MKPSHKDVMECLKFISSKKTKDALVEEICAHVLKIKIMIEGGTDINIQTKSRKTLLHAVLSKGMLQYNKKAKELYEANPIENKDFQPFDIKYLTTKFRPNPFIRDNEGLTPSMKALDKGLKDEFHWLLAYEHAYQAEKHSQALEALAILAQLVPNNIDDKDPYRKTVIVKAQRNFLNAMHDLSDTSYTKEN